MAEDPNILIQDDSCACPDGRLENFLSALFELKYSISSIEKKYSFLGNELSTLCEETISRLSLPSDTEEPPAVMETTRLPFPVEPQPVILNEANITAEAAPITPSEPPQSAKPSEPIATPVTPPASANKNSVAYSLDAAGGILITCLDKMGDGIIFAFEKLLSLGPKPVKDPPSIQHQ